MKVKYVLTLCLLWLCGRTDYSQVLYPTTNSVWYPGDKVTILWNTAAFIPGDTVTVILNSIETWPTGVGKIGITLQYFGDNTGHIDWTVPFELLAGSTNTAYQVIVYSNEPYGKEHSSGSFQIRFGVSRTRPLNLSVEKSVILRWPTLYGHDYEVQVSTDLSTTWTSLGVITANSDDYVGSVSIGDWNQMYRVIDKGEHLQ